MVTQTTDYVVFIGRMSPPHAAHISIVAQALQCGKQVIILIGSANQPRTILNPWTWKERADMIRICFSSQDQDRLHFRPLSDVVGNTVWALQVQNQVTNVIDRYIRTQELLDVNFNPTIKLIGHKKDCTSYYLDMFPQWGEIFVDNIDGLHATDIRNMMFEQHQFVSTAGIPEKILDYLKAFLNSDEYEYVQAEYDFLQEYRKSWESAPYPPTFVTVDAVVIQSGHILLIKRRSSPGKGAWAIVGGFVDHSEKIEDSLIRELREETKIKVPEPVLRGNIKIREVYDQPNRSLRGRTITHAYLIVLPPGKLPKVKGGDDAEKAKWIPLEVFEKMQDQMFEDHFRIVNDLLGKVY